MNALHKSWLADQADAIKYQREMRELDTYANPYRRAALIECHARLWAPEAKAVQPDEAAA